MMNALKENRVVASTKGNEVSSRSHSIFQLNIDSGKMKGSLCLVDLAGSEKFTGSEGRPYKEAIAINTSLLALKMVVTALKNGHSSIPYKDSLLTGVLKPFLAATSRIAMFVNISPLAVHYSDSIRSLEFGSEAAQISRA